MIQMNLQAERDSQTEAMNLRFPVGKGVGDGRPGSPGWSCTLYLKWITSEDLLYDTGNSAGDHVAAWMGGAFGGEGMPVYVWLSPFAVHLKPSQHC